MIIGRLQEQVALLASRFSGCLHSGVREPTEPSMAHDLNLCRIVKGHTTIFLNR